MNKQSDLTHFCYTPSKEIEKDEKEQKVGRKTRSFSFQAKIFGKIGDKLKRKCNSLNRRMT